MNSRAATPSRQPAVGFILALVLLDILGIGLMLPVLPALVGSLTPDRDAQTLWVGALLTGYGLMQFACAPLLGALSDRFGRRPVLLVGIGGLSLMFLTPALATSLWVILAARLFGGALAANLAVANAYLADVLPAPQRASAFGRIGAAIGVGFIIGPAAGGMLGAIDVRLPFFVAAALAALNFLYGWLVLPESLPPERRAPLQLSRANPLSALRELGRLRGIGRLVVVYGMINLSAFVVHSTWVLYTSFRHGWGPQQAGWSLFVVGVMALTVQGVLLSRLLRSLGARRLVLAGMTSALLAYLGYATATEGWMMYALIVANFLGFAVLPTIQGQVSQAADARVQGRTMGALSSLASIMMAIAPLIGTPLLAVVSHLPASDWRIGAPYFVAAALQAIALIFAVVHFRHDLTAEPSTRA